MQYIIQNLIREVKKMKKLSKVFARKTVSGGACVKQKKLKRGVLALLGAVMAVSLAGAGISYGLPVNAMSSAKIGRAHV